MDFLFDPRVVAYGKGGNDMLLEALTNNVAYALAEMYRARHSSEPCDDKRFYFTARNRVVDYLTNCQPFGEFERFIGRQALEYERMNPARDYAAMCFAEWVGAYHILINEVCLNGSFHAEAARRVNKTFGFRE